jgi:hypothetical protein
LSIIYHLGKQEMWRQGRGRVSPNLDPMLAVADACFRLVKSWFRAVDNPCHSLSCSPWWVRLDAGDAYWGCLWVPVGARLPKLFILLGRSQWETNFHTRRGHLAASIACTSSNSSRLHHLFPAVSKPYQLAAEQASRQHLLSGVSSSFIPSLHIAATVARLSIHSILLSHPVQQPFVLTLPDHHSETCQYQSIDLRHLSLSQPSGQAGKILRAGHLSPVSCTWFTCILGTRISAYVLHEYLLGYLAHKKQWL